MKFPFNYKFISSDILFEIKTCIRFSIFACFNGNKNFRQNFHIYKQIAGGNIDNLRNEISRYFVFIEETELEENKSLYAIREGSTLKLISSDDLKLKGMTLNDNYMETLPSRRNNMLEKSYGIKKNIGDINPLKNSMIEI